MEQQQPIHDCILGSVLTVNGYMYVYIMLVRCNGDTSMRTYMYIRTFVLYVRILLYWTLSILLYWTLSIIFYYLFITIILCLYINKILFILYLEQTH